MECFIFFSANAGAECRVIWVFFQRPMKRHRGWGLMSSELLFSSQDYDVKPRRHHRNTPINYTKHLLSHCNSLLRCLWFCVVTVCTHSECPSWSSSSLRAASALCVFVWVCVTLLKHSALLHVSFRADCLMDVFWCITYWCEGTRPAHRRITMTQWLTAP